ncbi:hypothetical protein KM043_000039, partial [Ampulex compressa]
MHVARSSVDETPFRSEVRVGDSRQNRAGRRSVNLWKASSAPSRDRGYPRRGFDLAEREPRVGEVEGPSGVGAAGNWTPRPFQLTVDHVSREREDGLGGPSRLEEGLLG